MESEIVHPGGYLDFEDEWFGPKVSPFTSIFSCPDISQDLLAIPDSAHRPENYVCSMLHITSVVLIWDAPEFLVVLKTFKHNPGDVKALWSQSLH